MPPAAFAASTAVRLGTAWKVVRIVLKRYSVVAANTAITMMIIIIMTIISGAIIPTVMGYLSDSHSVQWAYLVPLVCYFMVWLSTRLGGREAKG